MYCITEPGRFFSFNNSGISIKLHPEGKSGFYNMETILVTGGAGFIGTNFIRYILTNTQDIQVVNLDALTYAGNLESLASLPNSERHIFVRGRIEDTELVIRLLDTHEVKKIVHFAAETHVDRSIANPDAFVLTNVIGTCSLLKAALKNWSDRKILDDSTVRFHHISTDEVFGALDADDEPFDEGTPYAPNSPYSASKAASDHFVRSFYKTYGLPISITNCSNNYGPFQYPEKLIPLMVLNALEGKSLPVYGEGAQIRDWLYVSDHCDAIWKVLNMGNVGETYCVGGDTQPRNIEIVQKICQVLDTLKPLERGKSYASQIQYVTDRPGHDFRYAINTEKIKSQLGWTPQMNFDSGLKNTIQWYVENTKWVQQIRNNPAYQAWLLENYSR